MNNAILALSVVFASTIAVAEPAATTPDFTDDPAKFVLACSKAASGLANAKQDTPIGQDSELQNYALTYSACGAMVQGIVTAVVNAEEYEMKRGPKFCTGKVTVAQVLERTIDVWEKEQLELVKAKVDAPQLVLIALGSMSRCDS